MEINISLTAINWTLAPNLDRSALANGVLVLKNAVERTYLTVTPDQWLLLRRFSTPSMVPQVLEAVIDERQCPPLGEFYELILKAVRQRILIAPDHVPQPERSRSWWGTMAPARWRASLWVLFAVGLGSTLLLDADLPATGIDAAASLALAVVATVLGRLLAATLLRGAGREIYLTAGFLPRTIDACLLPPTEQRTVAVAPLATLAMVAGTLGWLRPEWSLGPLVALLAHLHPLEHGAMLRIIQLGSTKRSSDAEQHFIFPPNRTPRARWRHLRRRLGRASTWKMASYGVTWLTLLAYAAARLHNEPLMELGFWQARGSLVAALLVGLPLATVIGYTLWVLGLFVRDHAQDSRRGFALWRRRWFGRPSADDDANPSTPAEAIRRCPLFRSLPEASRQALAQHFTTQNIGAWKQLMPFDEPVTHVCLILSGKVGVYRRGTSGRPERLQVLCEDELVGLHAVADPKYPEFAYRTLTPVTLLRLEWRIVADLILPQLPQATVTNQVLKAPFLARLKLCRNWHMQAVRRFAELSRIINYDPETVIIYDGLFSESFFIVLEGTARVTKKSRLLATVRSGDFLGEVGLLQNSVAAAQVQAIKPTRCLSIGRREFLRFVAHNHSVALELERVSSKRLGHPIFPLSPGNFRQF